MSQHQANYCIQTMCRVFKVSRSGFYAWAGRKPSARVQDDQALIAKIKQAHTASEGTYGAPRIKADLAAQGVNVSQKRVARLMRQEGLVGVSRRKGVITTRRDDRDARAPDLVDRKFVAHRINELWVADITYIPTWAGFLYLAVVLDAFSRRIVGWAMALSLEKQIVLDALNMAVTQRRPKDVIHHSDQGSQYTSIAFGKRCKEADVRPSMGSVGDAYDNASLGARAEAQLVCESFFATLECELLDRRKFKTQAEAKMAVFCFIERFYNRRRRHSALGYLAPMAFERAANQPGTPEHAAVLATLKGRPSRIEPEPTFPQTAALDSVCARQQTNLAGRDEVRLQAEQSEDQTDQLSNPNLSIKSG